MASLLFALNTQLIHHFRRGTYLNGLFNILIFTRVLSISDTEYLMTSDGNIRKRIFLLNNKSI